MAGRKPESRLVEAIFKKVLRPLQEGAFFFKVHGGLFQRAGLPDIIGVYRGRFIAIEVKISGNTPTELQARTLRLLRTAGAVVGVAYSVEDAQQIIEEAHVPYTDAA